MDSERVIGVDACKAGWVAVVLAGTRLTAYFARTIDGLVALAAADGPVSVVAVDMPIGLPDRGRRRADDLAREAIGPLRSSVFITPVRTALEAPDYATAVARNRELAGEGISRQAFALKPKLLEVDQWARAPVQRESARDPSCRRIIEIHPEVSFARLAGATLSARKRTWAGVECRRHLLSRAGIALPDDLGPAGHHAAVDDVLDATVAAWTARRAAEGLARPRPEPPEQFSDGRNAAIWI